MARKCDHCKKPITKNSTLCQECAEKYYAWCLGDHERAKQDKKKT